MLRIITALLVLLSYSSMAQQQSLQPVNAVLLDQSYIEFMGVSPDENASEQLRIQIHLRYVENLLRQQDVTHLTEEQQRNRARVLDLLHTYWALGVFPTNYDYPTERKPCFIDRDGNICAVGYLVRETAGAEVADAINAQHQYDYIADMNEPVIFQWAEAYGLTLEECAMIQPQYGNPGLSNQESPGIKQSYGIASGFLGGTNLAINALNLSGRFGHYKTVGYVGLATGTANIILGLTNLRKDQPSGAIDGEVISYKAQNTLSYVNIAVGTTTVLTSVFNLMINKKERNHQLTIYSDANMNNSLCLGLAFTKRI